MSRRVAGALVALAITGGALVAARAHLARVLTAAGAPAAQRPLRGADAPAPAVARGPLRVVVLDGLDRAEATGPALDGLCARGLDLVVDVGFPTKSLPVQSVLWTGLTAQQTGLAMRNQAPAPLAAALPARLPGAHAVVEAWTEIARAVGFPRVDPDPATDHARAGASPAATAGWRARFAAVAGEAVAGPAPLVLVHVLAIDEAGHRGGRDAAYRAEVARADDLLAALLVRNPDATWLALADHGHLRGGGHGDAEPGVRLVRACVAPRPPGAPARGVAHLVDVSRHLHDVLGVPPPPGAVGRPLAVAVVHPDPGATLPRPSAASRVLAAVALALGLAVAVRHGRPRAAAAAPLLAAVAYLALQGAPSLSARSPGVALALGVLAAAAVLAWPGRRVHPSRVVALVLPALAAVVAGAILTHLPGALAGGPPARLPFVTAWLQIVATAVTPALLVGGALAGALLSGPRTSGSRTGGSGGSDQPVRSADGGAGRAPAPGRCRDA